MKRRRAPGRRTSRRCWPRPRGPGAASSKWWPDGVPAPLGDYPDAPFATWRYEDARWTDLLLPDLDPETRDKVQALAARSAWRYVRHGGGGGGGGSSSGVVHMQFGSALVMDPGGRLRPAEPGEADRLIGFAGEDLPRAP